MGQGSFKDSALAGRVDGTPECRRTQLRRAGRILCILAGTAMTALPAAGGGEPLSPPNGDVVLTVSGRIARSTAPGEAYFDRAMLQDMKHVTLQTATPWTNGAPVFRGVLVRDVLDRVGAEGSIARVIAMNDYRYDIPISDFYDYPVLLAFEMDGKPLRLRDKGPLWIIFPIDQFQELRGRRTERKMVWQLQEIHVK